MQQTMPPQPPSYGEPLRGVGALEALRRHPIIALLPLVLLIGGAVAYSLLRVPLYTAESRQAVGRIDVNQPGALAGFASATEALASTYARGIDSTSVVRAVARRSGLSVLEVRGQISATPVPESPVFRVFGQGDSAREAVDLANSAATALRAYLAEINAENPNATRLFREFERASLDAARRRNELGEARNQAGPNPRGEQARAIAEARSSLDSALLAVEVARTSYAATQASQANVEMVQTLAPARTATSDFSEQLQIALFAAIAAGALLGIAGAMLRSNRDVRREHAVA